jgi:hypothetical protein
MNVLGEANSLLENHCKKRNDSNWGMGKVFIIIFFCVQSGNVFYAFCVQSGNGCNYFEWADDVICECGKEVIYEQIEKIAILYVELAKSKSRKKAVSMKVEKLKMKLNVVSVCLALSWVIIGLYILMIVAIVVFSNKGGGIVPEIA